MDWGEAVGGLEKDGDFGKLSLPERETLDEAEKEEEEEEGAEERAAKEEAVVMRLCCRTETCDRYSSICLCIKALACACFWIWASAWA